MPSVLHAASCKRASANPLCRVLRHLGAATRSAECWDGVAWAPTLLHEAQRVPSFAATMASWIRLMHLVEAHDIFQDAA